MSGILELMCQTCVFLMHYSRFCIHKAYDYKANLEHLLHVEVLTLISASTKHIIVDFPFLIMDMLKPR